MRFDYRIWEWIVPLLHHNFGALFNNKTHECTKIEPLRLQ